LPSLAENIGIDEDMSEILKSITPWMAVVSAVVAGYLTFRNQMRLKAFELLLERRQKLLEAVEDRIKFYRIVLAELEENPESTPNIKIFTSNEFHDSLMLFHRAKGVALGPLADILIETYWTIGHEGLGRSLGKDETIGMIQRKINALAAFYGFAHSRISSEIETITLSVVEQIKRLFGIRGKLKSESVASGKQTEQIAFADAAKRRD